MAVWLPELDLPCEHCPKNPKLQIENGCLADSPIPDRWQIGKHTFQRCPGTLVTRQSQMYKRCYNWMNMPAGSYPSEGTWLEQTSKFIQAMEVIRREIAAIDKARVEATKTKGRA